MIKKFLDQFFTEIPYEEFINKKVLTFNIPLLKKIIQYIQMNGNNIERINCEYYNITIHKNESTIVISMLKDEWFKIYIFDGITRKYYLADQYEGLIKFIDIHI